MLIERLARTAAEPAQRGALDELTERGHADLKRRRGGGVGQPPKIVPLAALTTSTQAIWLAASYEHAYPTVALDYLQRGLSVASSDQERSAVLVARGEMLLRSGEVTVAFRTLAEAVALNPSFQENTSGYAAYLAAMREQARRSSNLAMRRDAIRLGDELLLAVPGAAGVWNTMGRLHADLIRHDLASAPASLRFLLEAERLGFERHELCYSLNQLWSRIRDVRDRAARSRRPDKSLVQLAEREMAQVDAQIARLGFAPRPRGA
jgi:tetratricopeptide (TPR) repeat protein